MRARLGASIPLFLACVLTPAAAESPSKCRDIDPRKLKDGGVCVASGGGRFKLLSRSKQGKEVWQDLESGLIWGDRLPTRHDRDEAKEICSRSANPAPGSRLPTREELELAEKRGFREAVPDMKDRYYWSSTFVPESPGVRYVFNGNFGNTFVVMYNNIPYESVRCVAQTTSK